MASFIKSLCLTLLFFAYTGLLIWGGTLLEKQIMDVEKAKKEVEIQYEINQKLARTAEEYHKHYELVVSRIKTSEAEGMNKDALKEYISGYDDRFKTVSKLFFTKKSEEESDSQESKKAENAEEKAKESGEEELRVPSSFQKAFDEAELDTYKIFVKATTPNISDEELETIFKD